MVEIGTPKILDRPDLDRLFLGTIRDIILDIFGKDSLETILQTMNKIYSLKWEDIPDNIKIFKTTIENLFGTGHVIIEDLIIENLYIKLGLNFECKKNYSFQDYIEELKRI